jgi:hypothetical protein
VEATVLWAGTEVSLDVQQLSSLNKNSTRMIETAVP